MAKLNWEIILSNVAAACEELERIKARVEGGDPPAEGQLQIMLEHAYHHLNCAWNVRHVSTKSYAQLTDADFNRWSQFPKEIEEWKIVKRKDKGVRRDDGSASKRTGRGGRER